jgi:hypothetical protein
MVNNAVAQQGSGGGQHGKTYIHFWRCRVNEKRGRICRVKYWKNIPDNLSKAGWSYGYVSAIGQRAKAS